MVGVGLIDGNNTGDEGGGIGAAMNMRMRGRKRKRREKGRWGIWGGCKWKEME